MMSVSFRYLCLPKHGFTTRTLHLANGKRSKCLKSDNHNDDINNDNIWEKAKQYNEIPGPKPAPIIGNIWRYFPGIGTYSGMEQHEIFMRLNEEFGDICRLQGLKFRDDLVICYNPNDIGTVYRNEGQWPKRDALHSLLYYRLKLRQDVFQGYGGIFTTDGEEWHSARSLLNPILMQPRTIKQYTAPIEEVSNEFVKRIHHLRNTSPCGEMPENFSHELNKWALESIGVMAMDQKLGLLNSNQDSDSESNTFITDVLNCFEMMYKLDMLPSPWKYISTPTWRKYVKTWDRITEFIQKQLDNALVKLEEKKQSETTNNNLTILEKLLKLDRRIAFGTILDMMIGGIDTTSRTMAATLYFIAANENAQSRLRQEIVSVLPSLDTPVTGQTLDQMPYLRAVLKEAMRLAPIAIGSSRQSTKDLVLAGYQIPKGTNFLLSNLTICMKEEYFPQAKQFIPERWLRNDEVKDKNFNPWGYQPFGFGPRACIGKRLANLELEILLAKIIRNFRMEWHHDEMKFKMTMLYGIDSPLKIKMIPLNS